MTTTPHLHSNPADGPDLDVLADLAGGLLGPVEERTVRAHVDSCADCTAVLAALDRTGQELRWLPPIPMPDDVVTRIGAALAEEGKVVSLSRARTRRKNRQRFLGIAAAGVVVLGGGVLAIQLGGSGGPDVTADSEEAPAATDETAPDLDEGSLPGAIEGLVTGGGNEPLTLEGEPGPQDCVPSVQVEGIDTLIGVIEIRFEGRNADAVFFATADPTIARVVVVDDCGVVDPEDILAIEAGAI